MKNVIAVVIAMIFVASPVVAANGAAEIGGEVLAYSNRCPTVEVDFAGLEGWSLANGVDIRQLKAQSGPDFDAVMRGSARATSSLRAKTVSEACEEALRMFGPGGSIVPGVLERK